MDYSAFTNRGERDYNEDSYGFARHGEDMCFILADGLGGHGGGEVASKIAVDVVSRCFEAAGYQENFFEKAFEQVQKALLAEQEKEHAYSKMKTTLVVLVIHAGRAFFAHVGDSRLYILKNQKIKKRTLDHSIPQMLALSGEIKDSDIRHHPDRSRLMRVMGVHGEDIKCEIGSPVKIKGSMAFLLCSDGYWELVDDKDIERMNVLSATPEEWIIQMNKIIQKNGEETDMDNYSAVAIYIKKKGLFSR